MAKNKGLVILGVAATIVMLIITIASAAVGQGTCKELFGNDCTNGGCNLYSTAGDCTINQCYCYASASYVNHDCRTGEDDPKCQ